MFGSTATADKKKIAESTTIRRSLWFPCGLS